MERFQIYEKVQEIFRDIFDDETLIITDETNSSEIEDWDSLNHINLVVAIEKEFKIKLTLDELSTLKNVGSMITLMSKKIA